MDTVSLPPASPLGCFPGGHLGWATDRMMGGGGGGGGDAPEKMGGGRDGMAPREGWLGQGLEQVCVLMGKDQQGGPARRLMPEERGGSMRIQVP